MIMTYAHLIYVVVSVLATIVVAQTLKKRGGLFIERHYFGKEEMARSLSDLLTIGFYLIHIGCVLLAIRFGGRVFDTPDVFEVVSTKVGIVLVVLAASHFIHFAILSKLNIRKVEPIEAEVVNTP